MECIYFLNRHLFFMASSLCHLTAVRQALLCRISFGSIRNIKPGNDKTKRRHKITNALRLKQKLLANSYFEVRDLLVEEGNLIFGECNSIVWDESFRVWEGTFRVGEAIFRVWDGHSGVWIGYSTVTDVNSRVVGVNSRVWNMNSRVAEGTFSLGDGTFRVGNGDCEEKSQQRYAVQESDLPLPAGRHNNA